MNISWDCAPPSSFVLIWREIFSETRYIFPATGTPTEERSHLGEKKIFETDLHFDLSDLGLQRSREKRKQELTTENNTVNWRCQVCRMPTHVYVKKVALNLNTSLIRTNVGTLNIQIVE